jgi:hypothetical protein
MSMYVYMQVDVYVCEHVRIYASRCVCMCGEVPCVSMYVYVQLDMYVRTADVCVTKMGLVCSCLSCAEMCVYVCMHLRLYVYMHSRRLCDEDGPCLFVFVMRGDVRVRMYAFMFV